MPPPGDLYAFILDIEGYSRELINWLVVFGLFWFRQSRRKTADAGSVGDYQVWTWVIYLYLAASTFLLITPLIPTPSGLGDRGALPFWIVPVGALTLFATGFGWYM